METDIAIIGGGLSGLALARKLQAAGASWQLFEGRDRVGGRALTHVDTDGAGFDLGPAWIWPHQPRVLQLLHDLAIATRQQHSTGRLVFEERPGVIRRDVDFYTMAGALRIAGGVGALANAMAQPLSGACHLGHHVVRISRQNDGFCIEFADQDQPNQYAKRLILSLPLRVAAETIDLSDILAKQALHAMSGTPTWMAGHGKVVAVFDSPFWRAQGLSGGAISHVGPLMEIHDASPIGADTQKAGPAGALFGFVHPAILAERPPEDKLEEAARQQIARLFQIEPSEIKSLYMKIWLADPLTATAQDANAHKHPDGGLPTALKAAEDSNIFFNISEVATQEPGLIEGALAVADETFAKL